MPVTLQGTQIVFNDSTTQSTANNLPANTTNVLNSTAAASVGAVGTYALLRSDTVPTNPGTTRAASVLYYASSNGDLFGATRPAGTWRCMGFVTFTGIPAETTTVWLRVS